MIPAKYAEWKILFDKIVPLLDEEVIFVGHSLGGIFLAKYLSEESCSKKVKAVFLVSAPFNTGSEWDRNVDFILPEDMSELSNQVEDIFLYHSKDDPIVPFSDCLNYKKALPRAQVKVFEDRQHFNQENFPEILEDIKNL
ncbi:MAG: alpha/beta fold hydrolase [Patescibacteria group bacterium]